MYPALFLVSIGSCVLCYHVLNEFIMDPALILDEESDIIVANFDFTILQWTHSKTQEKVKEKTKLCL